MKKRIISTLSITALLLAGCQGHDKHEDNSKDQKQTSSSKSTSSSDNKKSSEDKSKSEDKKMKEVTFEDLFKNGKGHMLYDIKAKSYHVNESVDFDNIEDENNSLEHMYYVKDNKGLEYNVDFNKDDSYTFKNFTKYDTDTQKSKIEKLEKRQLNDRLLNEDKGKVNYHADLSPFYRFNYVKDGKFDGVSYLFSKYDLKKKDEFDIDEPKKWMETHTTDKDLEQYKKDAQKNYRPSYNMTIKPFEYKGKMYAGLAEGTELDNGVDKQQAIPEVLITEVPKNTKIVVNKDHKDKNTTVLDYRKSDDGSREAKEKKNKEERDLDNI
ncbi:hypothetical protein [Staphylococcus pettenkoferi]|uniref:hypothetical protein n=1 Tax=Staphylococcus pettenkoferi TaxID=170573 RepID=UPI0011A7AEE8|nr:hypothetical protein [Staphylococcus pettenkoferi]